MVFLSDSLGLFLVTRAEVYIRLLLLLQLVRVIPWSRLVETLYYRSLGTLILRGTLGLKLVFIRAPFTPPSDPRDLVFPRVCPFPVGPLELTRSTVI